MTYYVTLGETKINKKLVLHADKVKAEEFGSVFFRLQKLESSRDEYNKEMDRLKKENQRQQEMINNLESRLDIYVYSPGIIKKFVFTTLETDDCWKHYELRGNYLKRRSNHT